MKDINFYQFYTERLRDRMIKIKPKKRRSLEKNPKNELLKGPVHSNIPHIPSLTDTRKIGSQGAVYSSIENLIDRAKKANRGIWRVSKRQVIDISKKYQFAIPNDRFPTKHLGSSGIILWRKGYNVYFLVKFRKQKYKR